MTFAPIATVAANLTTYSDGGLTAATAYTYRVRAYNAGGDSAYSNTASATTLPAPPTAPSSLAATATSTTAIVLAWTDTSNNEDGFTIERSADGATFTQVATIGANTTTYADGGLTAGTTYTYRVRAFSAGGDSPYSNTASATTLVGPPSAPTALAATPISSAAIALSWTDTANNEDGFKIERAPDGVTFSQMGTVGANVTTFTDTGLTAATPYTYRVRAYNTGGDSPYSAPASATTRPNPPATPTGLIATTVSNTVIALSWTDASLNEDGFAIEQSGDGVTFTQVATVAANTTTFSRTGLTGGTTYSFRVRAFNGGGNFGYSNVAATTTLVDPPAAPTNLSGTSLATSVTLRWTDNATTETGFMVERSLDGVTFTQIAIVAANVTTYTDSGLATFTQYSYRVRAYNGTGSSPYSTTVTIKTKKK